jgi:hypothetical protein
VNNVESTDKIGEGPGRTPEKPTDKDDRNLDWTQRVEQKAEAQKAVEEEQKEPISKMLIEHIQSCGAPVPWRWKLRWRPSRRNRARRCTRKCNPPVPPASD